MELKTLKDLEKLCKCKSHCECYEPTPETLRAEAVKWINKLEIAPSEFDSESGETQNIRSWIMRFFNITGEDLKCI